MHLVIQRTADLPPAVWDQVWAFTAAHMLTSRSFFEQLVRTKSHLVLIYTDAQRQTLVGTASVDTRVLTVDGRQVVMIYTGDVLLREDMRGQNILQRVGLRCFLKARLRHPLMPIYWYLGASTHQAYLVLARNLRTYWPRPEQRTPAPERRLIDQFACAVMPDIWDGVAGVFRTGGTKLLLSLQQPLTPREQADLHVRFFADCNPDRMQGDLLACLAPLDLANWLSIVRSSVLRAWRRMRR